MKREMNKTLITIIGVGFMASLVFVGSMISIPIPTILDVSRIHLGNIFCLLAAFLLGSWRGGLAAGIGSMLYDFTNPKYIADAPITFFNKFMMAYVCGVMLSVLLRRSEDENMRKRLIKMVIAAACGALTYVALYLGKSFVKNVYFNKVEVEFALLDIKVKSVASLFNAAIATSLSAPLAVALRAGLKRGGLERWLIKR